MYPRTLAEDERITKSEVKVYEAVRDGLPDDWDAFHSVGWVARDHAEGSDDGEIDMVLVHPDEGVVCVEVKGQGVECIGGKWFRTYEGEREKTKDPFKQALDHTHDLRRKIKEADKKLAKRLAIDHLVAFPMVTIHQLALAPDAPREILVDRSDLKDPAETVERVLAYHRGSRDKQGGPGEDGAATIRDLLSPDVLIEVPMAEEFLEEEEALITLTHQQAALLNRFGRDKRMVVTGCAGSGKTMLAVEQAKRRASSGERVLFVCFNKALAQHLRKVEQKSRVDFWNFHALCFRLASIAKVDLPKYEKGEAPQSYWDEDLPEALIAAVDELGPQYDAIFVDEAQDLHNDWLTALTCTMDDPDGGQLWLFMDDNQRVYDQLLDIPKEFRPFDLTVNCRNTQAIAREVHRKYEGAVEPETLGPEGREIELLHTDDQVATVAAVLERLCDREEVQPQDIVVLSSHGLDNSAVAQSKPGRFTFVKEPQPVGPFIRFSSIRGFKGLESPVVVLCELEDIEDETIDQQLYVAVSRAKNHCVIVAPATAAKPAG